MGSSLTRLFSPTAISNLYTKGIAVSKDLRQSFPTGYCIPNEPTRRLLAQLILEEAQETIEALGFFIKDIDYKVNLGTKPCSDLPNIIDGCCDTIYVCTGALLACGAPDTPHMTIVNQANDAKFPNGQVITNDKGKYLKPEGWKAPDHQALIDLGNINIKAMAETLVLQRKRPERNK